MHSLGPVLIVGAGSILFRDGLGSRQAGGIACSLFGVLVIITKSDPRALVALDFNPGDLIILFSAVLWAIYSACLRLLPAIHGLSFMFVFAVVSSLGTLPFAVGEHLAGVVFKPTPLTFGAAAYVAVFPSLIAFLCWNRGVALIGSGRAGVFMHLIPLFAAILATALLGERLMTYHVTGFALILGGVWLAARNP